MKRKIIPVLIGCTLSFSALAAQPTAERYVVSFPEGTHVNYAGAFASAFPNGLPVGIGSGLLFTGKQGDALTFATITDRGPNADSPKEGKNETKIFVTPDFAPLLMTIRVQNGKAEAIDPRPLHDDKGAINGLPLASDVIGSTNEVAFSDTLHRLKGDNRGLDTEGITPDGKGGYQRGSIIVVSQLPVENWYKMIGDSTHADAILDRLVHGSIKIELKGESMRKIQSPLTEGDQ
ncbi:ATP-binding protein [Escherichia coli]|uniref:ATP-binding protein n=1 Tax=Escherichia coli TaxID=562 RepID=UPI0030C6CC93